MPQNLRKAPKARMPSRIRVRAFLGRVAVMIGGSARIIGEAAAGITSETRQRFPEVPWASIVAMRNRLIHAYFDIDLDRVWDTVTNDLPELRSALQAVLATL